MLGNNIKKLRLSKKLTQEELGKILNKTKNNISQYETGKREPDNDTLLKLADFFKVSVDSLLGRKDKNVSSLEFKNESIEDNLIEKMKKLDDESKKELEKYMDLLKLKESMDKSKGEISSTVQKQA